MCLGGWVLGSQLLYRCDGFHWGWMGTAVQAGKSRRGDTKGLGPHCFFRGKSHGSVLGLWSSYGFPVSRPLGGSSRELEDERDEQSGRETKLLKQEKQQQVAGSLSLCRKILLLRKIQPFPSDPGRRSLGWGSFWCHFRPFLCILMNSQLGSAHAPKKLSLETRGPVRGVVVARERDTALRGAWDCPFHTAGAA